MAAIAGVVSLQPDVNAAAWLQGLLRHMTHRAPDGLACAGEARWALGHGALRVGGVQDAAPQPVVAPGHVLVMDGRMDDRAGLAAALGLRNDPPLSDAELVSQAWARWGEAMVGRLVGDFAVAVWDTREGVLWLLRDRVGVRPLYWVHTPHLLAFASEPEPLLALPGVSREASEERVLYALNLALGDGDPSGTWYRDVRKVLPGERLRISPRLDVEPRRWWRAAPLEPLRLRDDGEYVEAFQEIFGEAVRCRVLTSPRPHLMLSGGIDSAAILAMLRRDADGAQAGAIPVSVIADAADGCSESDNILRMLVEEGEQLRLPVPSFSGEVPLEQFAHLPWSPAHPVDNSLLLPMLVYRAVQGRGGRVVLDGIDGDLVMSTPEDYVARHVLAGHWRRAFHEARQAKRHHTYLKGNSTLRIAGKGLLARLEPPPLSRRRYGRIAARMFQDGASAWISPEVARDKRLAQKWVDGAMARRRALAGASPAHQLAYIWEHAGMNRGMEGYDHLAARFGIEPRHPWADQRVLDFFLRLPMEVVVAGGWTKHVARSACEPWLGKQVAWHSGKSHLGPAVLRAALSARLTWLKSAVFDARHAMGQWVPPIRLEQLSVQVLPGCSDSVLEDAFHVASLGRWLSGQGTVRAP